MLRDATGGYWDLVDASVMSVLGHAKYGSSSNIAARSRNVYETITHVPV